MGSLEEGAFGVFDQYCQIIVPGRYLSLTSIFGRIITIYEPYNSVLSQYIQYTVKHNVL